MPLHCPEAGRPIESPTHPRMLKRNEFRAPGQCADAPNTKGCPSLDRQPSQKVDACRDGIELGESKKETLAEKILQEETEETERKGTFFCVLPGLPPFALFAPVQILWLRLAARRLCGQNPDLFAFNSLSILALFRFRKKSGPASGTPFGVRDVMDRYPGVSLRSTPGYSLSTRWVGGGGGKRKGQRSAFLIRDSFRRRPGYGETSTSSATQVAPASGSEAAFVKFGVSGQRTLKVVNLFFLIRAEMVSRRQ